VCGKVDEGPSRSFEKRRVAAGRVGSIKALTLVGRAEDAVASETETLRSFGGHVWVDETPHARLESVGCGSWCGWAMKTLVLVCRAEGEGMWQSKRRQCVCTSR